MITEKVTRFKFFVCVSIILATIMGGMLKILPTT